MGIFRLIFTVFTISVLSACAVEPEPINFGNDHCISCKMMIADPKYGAELVTAKGRIYKFDAIECMLPYINNNPATEFSFIMAITYDKPESLEHVENLYFVKNEHFISPMGKNLAAFATQPKHFESMDWKQLQNTFN